MCVKTVTSPFFVDEACFENILTCVTDCRMQEGFVTQCWLAVEIYLGYKIYSNTLLVQDSLEMFKLMCINDLYT